MGDRASSSRRAAGSEPGRPGRPEPALTPPERARLFVALELTPPVRGELIRWRDETVGAIAGLRPVRPAALHATLCFLGSRPAAEIEAIAAAGDAIAEESPLGLSLGEPMWLPRRRPRVLAVKLVQDERRRPLSGLQSRLSQALQAGGFYEPPERPFLGHVTVARVAGTAYLRATSLPSPSPLRFAATRVTLYRSHLGRPEVRYEPLATICLREH